MMPKRFVSKTTFLLAGLVLAGCVDNTTLVPVATEPDLVGTRIAAAAEKASQALNSIAGIEQQRTPNLPPPDDYASAPPNMTQPITVKWTGPIEQITQTLATRAGLRFREVGSHGGVPLTVNVDVYQKPLIEVLRDVGFQAGQRANLTVDSQAGVVEISYAPVDKK